MSCPHNSLTGCDACNSRWLERENARLRRALETIRDTKQTASGARLLATHALQDGHTESAPFTRPAKEST